MSSMIAAGIALGGVTIAAVGAVSTYYMENKKPSIKSVMRDFIIGSVLVLMILQLLPDSISQIAGFLPSVSSLSSATAASVTEMMKDAVSPSNEMEIQVGVPGF
jgi:RsiW-degrading membrane proteinase PrsW (M82 family)